MFIENLYGEAKETIWHTLTFDESGHATVCEKRRVNGTFLEYLELETFPFDTQVSFKNISDFILTKSYSTLSLQDKASKYFSLGACY